MTGDNNCFQRNHRSVSSPHGNRFRQQPGIRSYHTYINGGNKHEIRNDNHYYDNGEMTTEQQQNDNFYYNRRDVQNEDDMDPDQQDDTANDQPN